MPEDHSQPRGELSLRTVAMPADTNPAGDIFGGWIMSLMDLAAGVAAGTQAKGRVVTAAVSNLSFIRQYIWATSFASIPRSIDWAARQLRSALKPGYCATARANAYE
jgi:Thioesterase superfamily